MSWGWKFELNLFEEIFERIFSYLVLKLKKVSKLGRASKFDAFTLIYSWQAKKNCLIII